MVDQRTFERIFKQVKDSGCTYGASHTTCMTCGNVLMHVDLFSGMYTSQGSGDILVRMCGSWEKFMVDLRSSERIFKKVKRSWLILTDLSQDLYACGNVFKHIDLFSGM